VAYKHIIVSDVKGRIRFTFSEDCDYWAFSYPWPPFTQHIINVMCHRGTMGKPQRIIFFIPFISLLCSFAILIGIYPYRPNSILSWISLYLLSIPIFLTGEYLGDRLLGNKYVSKLSSPVRIAYGVVVLSIFIIITIVLLNSSDPLLTKWGI
jgi:hypothetical protein